MNRLYHGECLTGDAHGVVDVHGLRCDSRVRQEGEDDLFSGRGQPVEPWGADETEKLDGK